MLKIGWFSTGRDEAAIDLFGTVMKAIDAGEIDGRIEFCFMNREPGEAPESDAFIEAVASRGVPIVHLSSKDFEPELRKNPSTRPEWRIAYDREVMKMLEPFDFDVAVLAGYMLIVGPEMCRRYVMLNLHPALPGGPVGTWQQVIDQLLETGAGTTGAMIHLATPDLDQGPAITYFQFPIASGETFDEIRAKGAARELPLIVMTVKAFADGDLTVRDCRVFWQGKPMEAGCDISDRVEAWLQRGG